MRVDSMGGRDWSVRGSAGWEIDVDLKQNITQTVKQSALVESAGQKQSYQMVPEAFHHLHHIMKLLN